MRKTQSLDEFGQSFSVCPSPTAVTDKNARRPSFEGGSPGLKRKTKSIESKEKRGMEAEKVKAMEDHSDMLFVTALEVSLWLIFFISIVTSTITNLLSLLLLLVHGSSSLCESIERSLFVR